MVVAVVVDTTNVLVILTTAVGTDVGVAAEVVEEEAVVVVDMAVVGCLVCFPHAHVMGIDSPISCVFTLFFPICCVSIAGMVEHREDALPQQVEMAKQVLTRLGDFSAMSPDDDDDLVSNIRALANLLVSIGK